MASRLDQDPASSTQVVQTGRPITTPSTMEHLMSSSASSPLSDLILDASSTSLDSTISTSTSLTLARSSHDLQTTTLSGTSSAALRIASARETQATSTAYPWDPAVTASSASDYASSQETGTSNGAFSQSEPDMTKGSKNILIATIVIGGTFIIALLIYAIYRRSKGATVSQILHLRPSSPSTVRSHPMRNEMLALPIYRENRYSVRSSTHWSAVNFKFGRRTPAVPPKVEERFHAQHPYIQDTWKTKPPAALPRPTTPVTNGPTTFLLDATPKAKSIKPPEKAHVSTRPLGARRSSVNTSTSLAKSVAAERGLTISVQDVTAPPTEAYRGLSPSYTPKTDGLLHDTQDRWSWTNSQAPTTPRMYAPSMHSTTSSMPRFRNVVSWVRGQTARIDEERPLAAASPLPETSTTNMSLPNGRRSMLKNQASKPNLAPKNSSTESVSKDGQTKAAGSTGGGGLGSMFKSKNRSQAAVIAKKEGIDAPTIEMSERRKS